MFSQALDKNLNTLHNGDVGVIRETIFKLVTVEAYEYGLGFPFSHFNTIPKNVLA
jgi:hypothetical protein